MLSWMITVTSGIAVVSLFSALPPQWLMLAIIFGSSIFLFITHKALLPFLFLCGVAWGVHYGYSIIEQRLQSEFEGQEVWAEGVVVGLPRTQQLFSKPSQRFDFQLTAPLCMKDKPLQCVSQVKRLQLRWYEGQSIKPGQQWRLLVKLKRPYGMSNPGGFDYQSWLIQQGINGVGYVRPNQDVRLLRDQAKHIDRIRWHIAETIDQHTKQLQHSAFLKALLIGDKRAITGKQWDLFAATGTSHLMVISGLHVGLISMLVYWSCRLIVLILCPRCAAERWAASAAIVAAFLYALAAGFSLPTQRALVMISTFMLVTIFRRNIAPVNGLVVALLLCLIIDPLAPISNSFWLSFVAVACLFYGVVGRRHATKSPINWMSAQYLVFIGLLPVLAMAMGRISLLSPVANGVLVPVFSLLLIPLNFIAALLSLFSSEWSLFIWQILDQLLEWSFIYLQWLESKAGGGILLTSAKHPLTYIIAALGVAIMLLPKGMPYRYAGMILLLPLLMPQTHPLNNGDIKLTVLDVGQGLSVVVQSKQHVLVYDVGTRLGPEFDVASAVVLPFLHYQGLNKIDQLVISHADNDHAGAWYRLPEKIPVKHMFYGEPLSESILPERDACKKGQQWEWNHVQFEFLHPAEIEAPDQLSANNHSCVLKITSGDFSFMLPGDIEENIESELVDKHAARLAANVLLAPHHGSNSSSSWPFIKSVDPDYVVFTSGYRNQFGHPAAEVIERYHQLGANMFTSSSSGAITFTVKEGKLSSVEEHRLQHKRYWF